MRQKFPKTRFFFTERDDKKSKEVNKAMDNRLNELASQVDPALWSQVDQPGGGTGLKTSKGMQALTDELDAEIQRQESRNAEAERTRFIAVFTVSEGLPPKIRKQDEGPDAFTIKVGMQTYRYADGKVEAVK